MDATFPVYELDDKYYMEIAEKYLGRDMFISGQMVKGIGVRASGLESAGVVNFKRGPQDKLYMYCEFGESEDQSNNRKLPVSWRRKHCCR